MDSRIIEKEILIHPEVLDCMYQLKARHLLPITIKITGETEGLAKVKLSFDEEDELLYQWLLDKASNERLRYEEP